MNKDRHFDVIIIGAGVVGCMVACGLSRYRVSIAVVEKESDVGKGSSAANSAIIHSAHDPRCVLTTSVRIKNGIRSLVPVRTPVLVSKKLLMQLPKASRAIVTEAPVCVGDVVLGNWKDLGIRLVDSAEVLRDDTAEI